MFFDQSGQKKNQEEIIQQQQKIYSPNNTDLFENINRLIKIKKTRKNSEREREKEKHNVK